MPTKTFLNLPKEKRLRILKAGKKEFSRVPFEKAVIANIAKDADIPRGSFYQYFENLEDLFTYIIDYLYGLSKKKFMQHLQENNNDVYEALKVKFASEIDKLSKEANRQFRLNTINILFNEKKEYPKEFVNYIFNRSSSIDIDFFPEEFRKREKFSELVEFMKMVGDNCTHAYLTSNISEEEIKENYNKYIDLVKMGYNIF